MRSLLFILSLGMLSSMADAISLDKVKCRAKRIKADVYGLSGSAAGQNGSKFYSTKMQKSQCQEIASQLATAGDNLKAQIAVDVSEHDVNSFEYYTVPRLRCYRSRRGRICQTVYVSVRRPICNVYEKTSVSIRLTDYKLQLDRSDNSLISSYPGYCR